MLCISQLLLVFLLLNSSIENCWARGHLQQPQVNDVPVAVEDNGHLVRCLEQILQPRVVGTAGHTKVQNFIVRELEELGFVTQVEHFAAVVPKFDNLTFANIVGILNPYADEYVALACHYDSKYFPNDPNFVGAIDSAVPCAILLNAVKTLHNFLMTDFKNRQDIGLMLIFFDGEEAFDNWSDEDSLYGSRHLAHKFKTSSSNRNFKRDIDRLKVLILLDLIGSANPRFYSFNRNTHSLHTHLWNVERNLMRAKQLETHSFMFSKRQTSSYVDDDHRPFQQQNVPILHLIPTPFPRVWHTPDDNAANLHWPTIRSFNRIFRQFLYDLLQRHSGDINFRLVEGREWNTSNK